MDRQFIVISEAERYGIIRGEDAVMMMGSAAQKARQSIQASRGFIDGLLENLKNGIPVDENKLIRLKEHYLGLVDIDLELIGTCSHVLWRSTQDEENAVREQQESDRSVTG